MLSTQETDMPCLLSCLMLRTFASTTGSWPEMIPRLKFHASISTTCLVFCNLIFTSTTYVHRTGF